MFKARLDSKKLFFSGGFLLALWLFYNSLIGDRVLPNTYIGDLAISGKSRLEAENLISRKFDDLGASPITFVIDDQKVTATLADLGINLDGEETLDKIFSLGRSGNLVSNSEVRMGAIFKRTDIHPDYRLDFETFSYFVETNLGSLEEKPANASIGYAGGKVEILPQKSGWVIDRNLLLLQVVEKVESLEGGEIAVNLVETAAEIDSEASQKALAKVQSLQRTKISLSWGHDVWRLTNDSLFNILRFYPTGKEEGSITSFEIGTSKVIIYDLRFSDSPPAILNVAVDKVKLDGFLAGIAKSIDRPKVDATLKFAGGKVSEFTPAVDGQKVDQDQARKLILAQVSIDNLNSEEDIRIPLPVAVTRARVESQEIGSLGIREQIGKGVSYYAGSIANRIYNIGLASSRITGTLVAPGEVFSFNKSVGEISAQAGYRQAYIISEGRTVLDDGGGVCQVSTTIFRAALAAGLPIVSRTAHAYRVGYYEQRGFSPGLDATVWAPGVDFAFKNDTNNHILVQAVMDRANAALEVDIYGTLDLRKVEISKSVIANPKPAPAARYQDDSTLPRGTVKQVDFAAAGGDVSFRRKVYKGGELIYDNVFKSFYRPWQAVYLVGTGT